MRVPSVSLVSVLRELLLLSGRDGGL